MIAGVAVVLVCLALPLDTAAELSGLIGASISGVVGLVTLTIKKRLGSLGTGAHGLRLLLSAQVSALMIRLLAVGVGAIAIKTNSGLSLISYLTAFFSVYVAQQLIEMRSLLLGVTTATQSEVSS